MAIISGDPISALEETTTPVVTDGAVSSLPVSGNTGAPVVDLPPTLIESLSATDTFTATLSSAAVVDSFTRLVLNADNGNACIDSAARLVLNSDAGTASVDSFARLALVSTSAELSEAANATDDFPSVTGNYNLGYTEAGNATDTFTATADYHVSLTETATPSETIDWLPTSGFFTAVAAETILADNNATLTVAALTVETALAEPCILTVGGIAVETLLVSKFYAIFDEEQLHPTDEFVPTQKLAPQPPPPPKPVPSTNLPLAQQPYPPVPTNQTDWYGWNQTIARTVNNTLAGKTNNTLDSFTFDANADSTTLYMTQIGATSYIQLTPITEDAMNEKYYISNQQAGQATITHTNSTSTDRTYRVVVIA